MDLTDSCSTPVVYPGIACEAPHPPSPPSPLPPPSPSPPSSPIALMDFPHNCFPGNSDMNGGVGDGTLTAVSIDLCPRPKHTHDAGGNCRSMQYSHKVQYCSA